MIKSGSSLKTAVEEYEEFRVSDIMNYSNLSKVLTSDDIFIGMNILHTG